MQLRDSFPLRSYLGLSLLGVGFGLAGAVGGATIASKVTGVPASAPGLDIAISSEPIAPSDRVGFVISTKQGNWFVLPVDATKLAEHRVRRGHLENNDGIQQVIEPLSARDVTPALRAWRDVKVSVQGGCVDTLRDFALITQLSGDAGLIEDTDTVTLDELGQQKWNVKAVQAQGTAYVAAKLEHCSGTYARAASAMPLVAFTPVEPDSDVAIAEKTLLASAVAKEVRAAFAHDQTMAVDSTQLNIEKLWKEAAQIHSIEMTDPRTHDNWIAVHVSSELSCGGPDINFFGLYRVAGDGIITMSEMKSDNLSALDALVDLDGDGVPELLGRGWLEPTHAFYSAELETLATYDIPFIGCPC